MEFVLHYRGPLVPNGSAADKHFIRKHFHPQLKKLWDESAFRFFPELLEKSVAEGGLIRELGGFRFASVVSSSIYTLAEVEITLLRPESPGNIVQYGGDIDNRLKTLLDGMAVPSQQQALPNGVAPDDDPFFCVLDDDRLITKLAVYTERLLESTSSPQEVELIVLVRTKKSPNEVNIIGPDDI